MNRRRFLLAGGILGTGGLAAYLSMTTDSDSPTDPTDSQDSSDPTNDTDNTDNTDSTDSTDDTDDTDHSDEDPDTENGNEDDGMEENEDGELEESVDGDNEEQEDDTDTEDSDTDEPEWQQGPPDHIIEVGPDGDARFSPESLEITIGEKVRWEWKSDRHNIVMQNETDEWDGTPGGDTDIYYEGYTYDHTFTRTGTYNYFCDYHDRMTGQIVVTR